MNGASRLFWQQLGGIKAQHAVIEKQGSRSKAGGHAGEAELSESVRALDSLNQVQVARKSTRRESRSWVAKPRRHP